MHLSGHKSIRAIAWTLTLVLQTFIFLLPHHESFSRSALVKIMDFWIYSVSYFVILFCFSLLCCWFFNSKKDPWKSHVYKLVWSACFGTRQCLNPHQKNDPRLPATRWSRPAWNRTLDQQTRPYHNVWWIITHVAWKVFLLIPLKMNRSSTWTKWNA